MFLDLVFTDRLNLLYQLFILHFVLTIDYQNCFIVDDHYNMRFEFFIASDYEIALENELNVDLI